MEHPVFTPRCSAGVFPVVRLAAAAGLILVAASGVRAQLPVVQPAAPAHLTAATPAAGLIDIQADNLSYDSVRRLVIARGDVKVTRGTESVAADYAEVDTAAETVRARGNIVIEYQGNTWKGEEATYNFKTGAGDFGAFEAFSHPYYVRAADSRRVSPRLVELDDAVFTTCEPDNLEYSLRASWASIEDNNIVRAKNVRFQLGPVPFFWTPYMKANLEELAKFEVSAGWSSRMGPFLLTAYNQPLNDVWRSRTHVDIRAKRGLGLGQDFFWEGRDDEYEGMVRAYYTQDKAPWRDDKQRREREGHITNDRYWFQLRDRHNLSDRDFLFTELNYVSDQWMLNDFFDDDYQKNVQPENRLTLPHYGDRYTAGVGLNYRLNDFYNNVNRLPEVFLNYNRQQILETPFYYESASTLSYLERVYPDGSVTNDYDAFRFDSSHMVYWPTRHFGFLSVIPRAGYRGTYFSKTLDRQFVTNVVTVTNALGEVTGTSNQTQTLFLDASSAWRNLPEVGVESSFMAFGEMYRGPTGIEEDEDLRHVFEPYVNYTFNPEPNVASNELWQFDAVDTLRARNEIQPGLRNYLQTKRWQQPHNLIYADVFTTLRLDPDEDQQALGDIGFKTEFRIWYWFYWDFNGSYDTEQNNLRRFSTQIQFKDEEIYTLAADYRYNRDSRDVVSGELTLFPEARWSARVYARMDVEESFVEEYSFNGIRRTRCLGYGLGVRVRPEQASNAKDDISVYFQLWPLAFPPSSSPLGGT
jgi:LPS-assembly protein